MKLGLQAPMGDDWRETLEKVRIAEDLGIEHITSGGESWGPSAIPWLTLLAEHTERATILPSILNVFSRSPRRWRRSSRGSSRSPTGGWCSASAPRVTS